MCPGYWISEFIANFIIHIGCSAGNLLPQVRIIWNAQGAYKELEKFCGLDPVLVTPCVIPRVSVVIVVAVWIIRIIVRIGVVRIIVVSVIAGVWISVVSRRQPVIV